MLIRIIFVLIFLINLVNAQIFTQITDLTNPIVSTQTGQNYSGAAWVDYNNDGLLDLFATPSFLFKNIGDGNFEYIDSGIGKSQQTNFSNGTSWADVDNDGDLDCLIAGNPSTIYINHGNDTFGEYHYGDLGFLSDYSGFFDLRGWNGAFGDYDNDGFVDAIITHPQGFLGAPAIPARLMHYNGHGGYEQINDYDFTKNLAPYTVATWSDYDLDGDIDLFIGSGPAGSTGEDHLYDNQLIETGTATLQRIASDPLGTTLQDGQVWNWIDYDNDGDLDGFLTNYGGASNRLYRNDEGTFVSQSNALTFNSANLANLWGDLDNDGDLDVILTGDNINGFYLNNGDGSFLSVDNEIAGLLSVGATLGDYDNDGDLDLFLSDGNQPNNDKALFRNDSDNENNWLNISLKGTVSNNAAIGAKVRVLAQINGVSTWLIRELSAQNSFNSHSSLRIHFGLGDATLIDSLQILWPSGQITEEVNLSVNQFLIYTEQVPVNFFRANFKTEQRRNFGKEVAVQFTDLTLTSESNLPSSWEWDFNNDGLIDATEQNPIWTFDSVGNYNIKLTVSDASHTEELLFENYVTLQRIPGIPIIQSVSPAFTDTTILKRETMEFTVSATDTSDYNLTYSWILNGGRQGQDTSFSYRASSFGVPRVDTLSLIISNGFNQTTRHWYIHVVNDITSIEKPGSELPKTFALLPNFPNPFNPTTKIRYQLPSPAKITLYVYNLLGQKIRTLTNKEEDAGFKKISWDGKDNTGQKVGSGFYFYHLEATQNGAVVFTDSRKMLMIK